MTTKVRVAILEDHESIIDGYRYRLQDTKEVQVVATANYSTDLEPVLQTHPVDILLMDVHVPVSADNPNPYPILQLIPKLRKSYPSLAILVISAHVQPELVKAVLNAGARGYVYKNDHGTIQNLGLVILTVAQGIHFMSEQVSSSLSIEQGDVPNLTSRQLEILSLFAAEPDLMTITVAQRLNISHSTVRNLLSKAYRQLGVQNLAAAISKMRELGIFVYPEMPLDSSNLTDDTPPSYLPGL